MGQINKLPKKEFPEFIGYYGITWNSFLQECNDKEITKYVPSVTLVHAYEENTLTVMKAFEKEVVLKNHTAEEADIVLSTCHSAKGMEWDSVELLDDFLDLSSIGYNMNHNTFCKKWQFDMLSYGDNLNLLYVALTRAKKKLCVPKSIMNLIHQFDLLHEQFRKSEMPSKNDKSIISLGKRQFSALEGWHLHDDLCMPLRKELEVPADSSISKLLFSQPQRGKRKRKLH